MLPKEFPIKWVVILGILILAVVGSSLFLSRQSSLTPKTTSETGGQRVFPTEVAAQINSNLKIIYQDANDVEGRTELYQSPANGFYNGVGIFGETNKWPYMIGLFNGWEGLPETSDRLLSLLDPINNSIIGQVHVVFVPNGLFTSNAKTTRLSVENIGKVKSEDLTNGSEDYQWSVGIDTLNNAQLTNTLRVGDALVVYPLIEKPGSDWKIITDNNGRWYAYMILLRRTSGAQDIKL